MPNTLTENFVEQFTLCKVTADETIGIIAELGQKDEYVAAAVAAARQLGAGVLVLHASSLSNPNLPPYVADGREVAPLLAAAGECDFVVDVTVGGLIHSDVRTRITGNGKRMLFVAEPNDVLERLSGNIDLRSAVESGGNRLRSGSTLRVTNDAGMDLTADISGEDLPITHQWGYVDEPGRWDHWPSGFVACFPQDRTAEGRIVLQPGDALIPWQRYVRDTVTLEVEKGFIKSISGEGADAHLLNDYFEAWNDSEVWALSHMLGLARTRPMVRVRCLRPPHSVRAGTAFHCRQLHVVHRSNRFADRETPAHLDIPMRGCTVEIDGVAVVRDGKLVTD